MVSPGRIVALLLALAGAASAQTGTVHAWEKYSQQLLDPFDSFGGSVAGLGDVDGDGVGDLAVGAVGDDDGGSGNGAVWILFLTVDGSVRSFQKISELSGRLEADFFVDIFGRGVAGLGDLDGDGVPDLAVAAPFTDTPGNRNGAAWILFLERDGTVKDWSLVAPVTSLGGSQLADSVSCPGDVDGDGVVDLVLGHVFASDGGLYTGAVWILLLNRDGTRKAEQKISQTFGGFGGDLDTDDRFGVASASPGDLDGDGVPELAVGAYQDDDGGPDTGAVWILFLTRAGTVKAWQKIGATSGGFAGTLEPGDLFGAGLARVGDLDGDGIGDLAVGAVHDDDGGTNKGAVWILHLRADGTVKDQRKISSTSGAFHGALQEDPSYAPSRFGSGIASLGDLDGNGVIDLAVGTPGQNTPSGGRDSGSVWLLRMNNSGASVLGERQYFGERRGWGSGRWVNGKFGSSMTVLGDVDGDGVRELAVGAQDGGTTSSSVDHGTGGVWILYTDRDGAIERTRHIGDATGLLGLPLDRLDSFGCALASPGDLDGDGIEELAVGASGDDDGGPDRGAVWILFLDRDGRLRRDKKLSSTQGSLGPLPDGERFGTALAALGDLDGNGVVDLAVGSSGSDDGGTDRGALRIVLLNGDGTVRSLLKISQTSGGFGGTLANGHEFGSSLASLGDLDGDGLGDLAVGAPGDDAGGLNKGAVWILFLAADGSVRDEAKITANSGDFAGPLLASGFFGASVAALGDLDLDGIPELAVGANREDPTGLEMGAVWILFLRRDGRVRSAVHVVEGQAGLDAQVNHRVRFGSALAVAETNGDGVRELLVGAPYDGDLGQAAGAVWSLSLEGVARIDFETRDDFVTPLVDGQEAEGAFGRVLTLASFGPNAGAALFDSTPGGPNDPSQDPDLLVGSGQLLILQTDANTTQSVPGVFDRPNDDEDGGLFVLDFHAAIRPEHLDLIDIDSSSAETSTVTLLDVSGRRRVFLVPPDWTGDLLEDGVGRRTLELDTLAPQPGFGATATATQQPGFDGEHVLRIEVQLGSTGALDDLVWGLPRGEVGLVRDGR
jgi:FG-GAP repeat protein